MLLNIRLAVTTNDLLCKISTQKSADNVLERMVSLAGFEYHLGLARAIISATNAVIIKCCTYHPGGK